MAAGGAKSLRMTRSFSAPRAEVYRAITDPEQLARWWGPVGFTCPSIDFEPRVGAGYRIAMQPPDGDRFHLWGEFREVAPPRLIAFTFNWEPPTIRRRSPPWLSRRPARRPAWRSRWASSGPTPAARSTREDGATASIASPSC